MDSTSFDGPSGVPLRKLSVCLINPRFEPSYWGYDFVLPLVPGNKRCWVVTGALPALAALAPAHCEVVLIDENVEPIDLDRLHHFDVIGVTGMVVQAQRMREILLRIQGLKAKVVVGGPYVSVAEAQFVGLCDARFIGEAEETWPAFLMALGRSEPVLERYEQAEKSDMERVPVPRYHLIKADRYMMASLQFSRGCPFLCEFCDIITIFGRKPRLKTPNQMIAEIEAIHAVGFRHCFLVDDNFIGNKVKAKELLRALIPWQRARGYPISFTTEASINLADDPEMIALMADANIRQVFIGVESPRAASLNEVRKSQNTRGDSQEDKLQRIRDGGLVIMAGFIVGFDNDDEAIFDDQFDFIQRAGIAQALVAVLTPIPTTPLYERLKAERRLDPSDPEVIFHPKGMSREALKRGYAALMQRLYVPGAYFERLFGGYASSPAFRRRRAELDAATARNAGILSRLQRLLAGGLMATRLAITLVRAGQLRSLGLAYLQVWFRQRRAFGAEAVPFSPFVVLCAVHWHFYNIAQGPRRGAFGAVLPVDTVLFTESSA